MYSLYYSILFITFQELGKIIERDFFPDLENLKDKVDFLEAKQHNDVERLQSLYKKYSTGGRLPTPTPVHDSPATFDTPEPNTRPSKRKKVEADSNADTSHDIEKDSASKPDGTK